jgi:ankyrin repeat protein
MLTQTAHQAWANGHLQSSTPLSLDILMVRLLLDNGANVNEVYICCFSASTPLMEAARYNHLETARLLLARGADVHFRGYEEWTALKDAEQAGNQEMIDLLDAAGAMSWRHRAERRLLKLLGKDLKEHHYRYPD